MRQRWIFAGLLVLMVGGIVAAVAWWGPDRDWDRHDRVEVVRVTDNGDTTTLAPGDTIIVERGGPRFFPFALFLFPLGFFAFFFLLLPGNLGYLIPILLGHARASTAGSGIRCTWASSAC